MSSSALRFGLLLPAMLLLTLVLTSCQNAESISAKGQSFLANKQYEDAELQFRRALQKDANLAAAHFGLARSLEAQNRTRDAIPSFVRAFELDSANPEVRQATTRFLLDLFLASRRRPKAIYDHLNRMSAAMLNADPNSPEGLTIRGTLAMSEKNYSQAVADLRKVESKGDNTTRMLLIEALFLNEQAPEAERLAESLIARDPKNREAYGRLYTVYLESNRPQEAGRILERQLTALPNDTQAALQQVRHSALYEKDPQRAQARLKEVLAAPDRFPNGTALLASSYMEGGDFVSPIPYLQEALARGGTDKIALRKLLAECFWQSRQLTKAEEQLRAAKAEAPNDNSVKMAEVQLLVAKGKAPDATAALKLIDELRAANYNDPQMDFFRGRALILEGKNEEGVKLLQESSRRQRGNLATRFTLATYYLSHQQYTDALVVLDEIDRISPDNERATRLRIAVLRQQGRLDEARNILNQLKSQQPDLPWLVEEQALQALVFKRYPEALEAYQKLYKGGDRSLRIISGLVQAYNGMKNFAAANALINEQLRANPNSSSLRVLRADQMILEGRFDSAIAEFEKLVSESPADDYLLRRLARLYHGRARYPDAIQQFAKIEQAGNSLPDDYGYWLDSAMKAKNGQEVASVCTKLEPKLAANWTMANNCAYAMAEANLDLTKAESIARAALQKQPNQPNLRDTLAFILFKQGKKTEALNAWNLLLRQEPNNPSFRYHRALVLLASNQTAEAKADLEAALAAKPGGTLKTSITEALKSAGQ